jgi:hypothetical protein
MVVECADLRVSVVRDTLPGLEVWLGLRRHTVAGELPAYLCHAPVDTAPATLVPMSSLRWLIET